MEYDNENLAKHEIMKIRIQDERPGKSRNKMWSRFPLSLPQVPIFSYYHTIPCHCLFLCHTLSQQYLLIIQLSTGDVCQFQRLVHAVERQSPSG